MRLSASTRWKQRIERIEQRMGMGTRGPQAIYILPSLEADDTDEDTPWRVKLGRGLYAEAYGRPFSPEQIEGLRIEYGAP